MPRRSPAKPSILRGNRPPGCTGSEEVRALARRAANAKFACSTLRAARPTVGEGYPMPEVEPVCDENRTVQPCAGPAGGEWSKGGWIGCFSAHAQKPNKYLPMIAR